MITAINRGEEVSVSLPVWTLGLGDGTLTSLLNDQKIEAEEGKLELHLPKHSSLVLHKPLAGIIWFETRSL